VCQKIGILSALKNVQPDKATRDMVEELTEEWLNSSDDTDWYKWKNTEPNKELTEARALLKALAEHRKCTVTELHQQFLQEVD
jgi:hypothetical protein